MKKNIILWTLTTVLLSACGDQKQVEVTKVLRPVRVMTVADPELSQAHEFTAVVDAYRKADLSFKVSGELIEFKVNEGERVVTGQLIAKLNDRDIKIQLQEAQSSFEKASADFSRAKNLIRSNTISTSDFDQLKAQHNSAKSKLAIATNNLEYTELRASFDGVIAKKYTENFQEINAKSAVVALHDLKNIVLKIDVSESIMINVERQDSPTILTATFEAIKGVEFPLLFKEVTTQADDVTKTYRVTLMMAAPTNHTILPGMTASVRAERLLLQDSDGVQFYLPVKTVLKDSRGHYVFTVVKKADGIGQIKRRAVSVGQITTLGIEIFDGIGQGDVVLTAGMSKVSDGVDVKY